MTRRDDQFPSHPGRPFAFPAGRLDEFRLPVEALTQHTGWLGTASFAAGIRPIRVVSALPASGDVVGDIVFLTTDQKLYRWTGTAWTAAVPAADITGQLVSSQIADAAINTAKFAAGIRPIRIVATLPASGDVQGDTVLLTTDNKLYRWTGSAWTAAVPTSDLTGTISNSQIANGAVSVAKFAAGITPVRVVSALPSSGNTEGDTAYLSTDKKLYRYNGTAWIASVATADLTGTISSAQIADGSISGTKFASGLRPVQVVGTLPSAGMAEGDMAYLTTDDKLYRYSGTAWIATVAATDLTGSITSTQITDGAVTTPKMTANSINGDRISAGTLDASKIVANSITAGQILAGAISATELAANAVTAAKIAAGAVTTAAMTANTINGDRISAGTLDASKIVADSITAGQIAAGAISTSELAAGAVNTTKLVAGFKNFLNKGEGLNAIKNFGFEDDTAFWNLGTGATVVTDSTKAHTGNKYLQISCPAAVYVSAMVGDDTGGATMYVEVDEGDTLYFGGWVYRESGDTKCQIAIEVTDKDKANPTYVGSGYVTTAAWTQKTTTYVVPAGKKFVRLYCQVGNTGTVTTVGRFDDLFLHVQVNGASIVAGSITTNHMTANTINGDRISAGTLDASKIVADSITAGQIAAGAISTSELAAGAVTAAKIAAHTITANEILAATITATEIAAGSITADRLVANSITAGQIAAGAISTSQLATGALLTGSLALRETSSYAISFYNSTGANIFSAFQAFSNLTGQGARWGAYDPANPDDAHAAWLNLMWRTDLSKGVLSFTGDVNITGNINATTITGSYTVDASTLVGTTMAANVVNSSLTKVGTVTLGTWNATAIAATFGGTGQTSWTLGDLLYSSAANTLAKLAGNTTATRKFLRQTGTGTVSAAPAWDTLVAGDIPSLDTSKLTSGVLGVTRGGTGISAFALGDMIYGDTSGLIIVAGNTTATKKFWTQTGTGTASAAPGWNTLVAGDIPALDTSKITTGILASARISGAYTGITGVGTLTSHLMVSMNAAPDNNTDYNVIAAEAAANSGMSYGFKRGSDGAIRNAIGALYTGSAGVFDIQIGSNTSMFRNLTFITNGGIILTLAASGLSASFAGNVSATSGTVFANAFQLSGASSIYSINRRDNNASAFGLYSPAGELHIWNYGSSVDAGYIGTDNTHNWYNTYTAKKSVSAGRFIAAFYANTAGSAVGNEVSILLGNNSGSTTGVTEGGIHYSDVVAGNGAGRLKLSVYSGAGTLYPLWIDYDGSVLLRGGIDNVSDTNLWIQAGASHAARLLFGGSTGANWGSWYMTQADAMNWLDQGGAARWVLTPTYDRHYGSYGWVRGELSGAARIRFNTSTSAFELLNASNASAELYTGDFHPGNIRMPTTGYITWGLTSSYAALSGNGAVVEAVLADASNYTSIRCTDIIFA